MSLAVALLASEGLLRLRYDDLPSLAALDGTGLTLKPADPSLPACPERLDWADNKRQRWRDGPPPLVRTWFVGDSTTAAVGVLDEQSWWLNVGYAVAGQGAAQVTNLAVPGASICGVAQQLLDHAAKNPPPDLLFVGVFADDLEEHQVLSVKSQNVLLPGSAPAWLRPWVTRSYAANLVWFAIEPRRDTVNERALAPQGLVEFRAVVDRITTWAESHQVEVRFVVMAPSGQRQCPDPMPPGSDCQRFAHDLDRMAEALIADGRPVLDLRPWFAATDVAILTLDHELVEMGHLQLPLHVGVEGQQPLAQEVLRLYREPSISRAP